MKGKQKNMQLKLSLLFLFGVPFVVDGRRDAVRVVRSTPGPSGPGSSPGREHSVVFLGKTLNSHVTSRSPVYKRVPANLMLVVTLQRTSVPSLHVR